MRHIQPSRLRVLALLAAVVGTGPLAAQTTQDPVILLVPGYTVGLDSFNMKNDYFSEQRRHFTALGRDVLYLNTPNDTRFSYRDFQYTQFDLGPGHDPQFDSRNTRIDLNAIEIVAVLRRLRDMGRKVTIVSHSKGGQDVLHALVDLDGTTQQPRNRDLWPIVTGWLAFTSNFFESRFEVDRDTVVVPPGSFPLSLLDWLRPTESSCPFRYSQYHVDSGLFFAPFIGRQMYMRHHRAAIADLTANMRILCAYGAFIPELVRVDILNPGDLDLYNMQIQKQSQDIELLSGIRFCGANDGIVPMRAAQLPGARFVVRLPSDTTRSGADHDSPAGARPRHTKFWTPAFRNRMTAIYISALESFRSFGSGCGRASGIPQLDANGSSVPVAGGSFSLKLSSLPAGAPTTMMLGLSNQQSGSIALPLDLTFLGAPRCFLLVSAEAVYSLANTNGVALWTIDIPRNTQLVGLRFFNQGLVLDASANGLGIALSNGGVATITAN